MSGAHAGDVHTPNRRVDDVEAVAPDPQSERFLAAALNRVGKGPKIRHERDREVPPWFQPCVCASSQTGIA